MANANRDIEVLIKEARSTFGPPTWNLIERLADALEAQLAEINRLHRKIAKLSTGAQK